MTPISRTTLLQGLAGLAAVLAVTGGLIMISHAPRQGERLARLQASAKAMSGPSPAPASGVYPVELCRGNASDNAAALGQALREDAASLGAELTTLSLEPLPQSPSIDLDGAVIRIALTGEEAALVGFFKRSTERRMPVFLDRVEISARAPGDLSAQIEGRIICRRDAL